MEKKTVPILVAVILGFSTSVFAETIVLKSGQKIEAKIIERTDEYIKIDFYGVPLSYYFEDIETIDGKKSGLSPLNEEVSSKDHTLSQQNNVNLVEFNSPALPVTIKYPANWFVKEGKDTVNNTVIAYLSREQIETPGDMMQVGASIMYFKDDQASRGIPWEHYIAFASEAFEKQGYKNVALIANIEEYGYPAFMLAGENQKLKMMQLTIKIDEDLLLLALEAPLSELSQYEEIFANMLSSLAIKK